MLILKNNIEIDGPIVDFIISGKLLYVCTKSRKLLIFKNFENNEKEIFKFEDNLCLLPPHYLLKSNGTINIIQKNPQTHEIYTSYLTKIKDKIYMAACSKNYYFLATDNKKVYVYDKSFSHLTTFFTSKIEYIFAYGNFLGVISQLDTTILVIDIPKKENIKYKIGKYLDYPHTGIFLSNKNFIIGTDKSIYKFDMVDKKIEWSYEVEARITCVEKIKNGSTLCFGDSEGNIFIADVSKDFTLKWKSYIGGIIVFIKNELDFLFIASSSELRNGRWITKKDSKCMISIFNFDK